MSSRYDDTDRFDTWSSSLFISFMSVSRCLCVHVLLAREATAHSLKVCGVIFTPWSVILVVVIMWPSTGAAPLTLVMFTGGTGCDSAVLVGDKLCSLMAASFFS